MKKAYTQRFSPGTALTVIGLGVGLGVSLMGVFAGLQGTRPGYCWWWPTRWMASPALVTAVGLVLLILPDRRSTSAVQTPPVESGAVRNELAGHAHNVVQAAHVGDVHFYQASAISSASQPGSSVEASVQGTERYRVGEGAPGWEGLFEQALLGLESRVVQDVHGVDRVLSGLRANGV